MQTLMVILKIILVVVPVILIVAFTTVAKIKTMVSKQIRLTPNIGYHGILQKLIYALNLLLAFLFRITLIKFFGLNIHLLLDYLLCTVPVNLVRLKNLSFSTISYCIIFSIIIFYVKAKLAILVSIIAVSLPWDVIMSVNNKVSLSNLLEIPGEYGYKKTFESLSNGSKKNIDFDFPLYVPGAIDQNELGKLLAIIVYERYNLQKYKLENATLSPSGHDYLEAFLKENNYNVYYKGYVDIKPNRTPGLGGTVRMNSVLETLNNVCVYKRPR